jgi:hypothetical protein
MASLFGELRRLRIRPTLIGLEFSHDFEDNLPEMAASVQFMNRLSLELDEVAIRP